MSAPSDKPGKWSVVARHYQVTIYDEQGEPVGFSWNPEHAERIVRAVNREEGMLTALKRIRLASRGNQFEGIHVDRQGDCTVANCDCSNHIARAAIAEAEAR